MSMEAGLQASEPSPAISVVMPMRNAARYVVAAVRSVLDQAGVDLELVVVDDGSSDNSRPLIEALADPRIVIVEGESRGIAAAFNTGLRAARGQAIARCDADDLYEPDRLAGQWAWLRAHAEFGAVCGAFATVDARGRLVAELNCGSREEDITSELAAGRTRTHLNTYLVRAEALRALGGCRPYFESAEDIDLQLRLGTTCRVAYTPGCAYRYRLHGSSVTHTQANPRREFFERAARQFCAQRAAGGADDLDLGRPPTPPAALGAPPLSPAAQVQGMLISRAWREHGQGHLGRALRLGLRACLVRPMNLTAWRSMVALMVKRPSGTRTGEDLPCG